MMKFKFLNISCEIFRQSQGGDDADQRMLERMRAGVYGLSEIENQIDATPMGECTKCDTSRAPRIKRSSNLAERKVRDDGDTGDVYHYNYICLRQYRLMLPAFEVSSLANKLKHW